MRAHTYTHKPLSFTFYFFFIYLLLLKKIWHVYMLITDLGYFRTSYYLHLLFVRKKKKHTLFFFLKLRTFELKREPTYHKTEFVSS